MKIRVYYEDTDAGGIVYHSNYLKFCERARSEIIFNSGLNFSEKAHFVVSKIVADFVNSAKLGDILNVKTRLVKLAKASVILEQEIYKDNESRVLLFKTQITLAFLSGKKISRIPLEFANIFLNEIEK